MSKTRGRKPKYTSPEEAKESSEKVLGENKVFLLPDHLINDKPKKIVELRHPATGQKAYYMLVDDIKQIFEIMEFNEPNRSWFIDDTVCSNGRFYITTKLDPIYLIVHYLRESCMENAAPLDQVLKDDKFPDTHLLVDYIADEELLMIADQKGTPDLRAFKYNNEKMLYWLKLKMIKLKEVLKAEKIDTGTGATSSTFVKSESETVEVSEDEQNVYAHGLLSDYLCQELVIQLSEALGLPKIENKTKSKRKSINSLECPDVKRVKTEKDEADSPVKAPSPKEADKRASTKTKNLEKAAKGSKNIMSFFSKK